jgi:hypothetical protein
MQKDMKASIQHTALGYGVALIISAAVVFPSMTYAQQGMSLTVTPPLFQFTLTPGETWASSIKVVNGNDYDLTVYATPINFESTGEDGRGRYVPLSIEDNASSTHSLAGWIDITDGPINIPRGQSARIPFFITAPENAEPGGHYASVLIGTRPPDAAGSEMKVSSMISALLFARVSGDIVEEGRIREFSTEKTLYEKPEAHFTLRFENIGNVHVLPRGSIIIYNMWGKERGRIDVNKEANFGNVFPGAIRNFSFDWVGETNFYDIGRYKAIATLSFGAGERQSDYQEVTFWVVPIKPLFWVITVFGLFVAFMTFSIRRYIRHALQIQTEMLVGSEVPEPVVSQPKQQARPKSREAVAALEHTQSERVVNPIAALKQPVIQGAVDLRRARVLSSQSTQGKEEVLSSAELLKKYRKFFIFLFVCIIFGVMGIVFFKEVLVKERNYEIQIQDEFTVTEEV